MEKVWVSNCFSKEEQAAMDELYEQAHKCWLDVAIRKPDMESFRDFDAARRNVARVFGAAESALSVTREGVRFSDDIDDAAAEKFLERCWIDIGFDGVGLAGSFDLPTECYPAIRHSEIGRGVIDWINKKAPDEAFYLTNFAIKELQSSIDELICYKNSLRGCDPFE